MVQEAPRLKGKTIVITRALSQAGETKRLIEAMGGRPYHLPTIKLKPLKPLAKIRRFIRALEAGEARYVVFMSANSVKYFYESLKKLEMWEEAREALREAVIAAVGPKTAKALEERGLDVKLTPGKFSSEGILEALREIGVEGETIYIFRAKDASPMLRDGLRESGASVREIYLYRSVEPCRSRLKRKFLKDLCNGKIDAIVFGSSKSVQNFFQMFKDEIPWGELQSLIRDKLTVVAIGPFTAKALTEMGLKVDVIPDRYTFEGALTSLANFWSTTEQ